MDLNVNDTTIQLLENNLGETPQDLQHAEFLDLIPKASSIKGK